MPQGRVYVQLTETPAPLATRLLLLVYCAKEPTRGLTRSTPSSGQPSALALPACARRAAQEAGTGSRTRWTRRQSMTTRLLGAHIVWTAAAAAKEVRSATAPSLITTLACEETRRLSPIGLVCSTDAASAQTGGDGGRGTSSSKTMADIRDAAGMSAQAEAAAALAAPDPKKRKSREEVEVSSDESTSSDESDSSSDSEDHRESARCSARPPAAPHTSDWLLAAHRQEEEAQEGEAQQETQEETQEEAQEEAQEEVQEAQEREAGGRAQAQDWLRRVRYHRVRCRCAATQPCHVIVHARLTHMPAAIGVSVVQADRDVQLPG